MSKEMQVKSPLEMLWHWENTQPNTVYLSQPKDGRWIDYTWKKVADEVRAMAGVLQSYGFPAGSKIASLQKMMPIGSLVIWLLWQQAMYQYLCILI